MVRFDEFLEGLVVVFLLMTVGTLLYVIVQGLGWYVFFAPAVYVLIGYVGRLVTRKWTVL